MTNDHDHRYGDGCPGGRVGKITQLSETPQPFPIPKPGSLSIAKINGLKAELQQSQAREKVLREACEAALRYDEGICGRAARGEVDLLGTGAGIAEGVDLDTLYDDWISKAKAALAGEDR